MYLRRNLERTGQGARNFGPATPVRISWIPSAGLSRRAARLFLAGECRYERATALSKVAIDAQTAAARGLGVAFVDMNDQLCASARCPVMKNGIIVFTDDNHLTASFSSSVAPVLGVRLEAAVRGLSGGG